MLNVSMTTMLANIAATVDDISVVTNDTNATVTEISKDTAIIKNSTDDTNATVIEMKEQFSNDTEIIKNSTNDTNANVAEMKEQLNAILKLFGDSGIDKKQLTEIQQKINEQDTVVSDNEMKEILQNARNLEKNGKYKEGLVEFVKYYAILQKQGG